MMPMSRWLALFVTLWTGAVLAVAFIAAPAAFLMLPSKELAGSVAAQLFKVEAYGTIFVAAFAWIALRPSAAMEVMTQEGDRSKAIIAWPLWIALLLILIATILGYFVLTPQMMDIKSVQGSGSSAYAQLHGASMGLYALKSLAWLALSALLIKRI
jgi:magnesium-transporting ATPase (P-type)